MVAQVEFQDLFDRYVERYMAGDAKACAAYYSPDGEIHSPFGPPVVGRAAIENAHADWFLDGEINKTITIVEARAEGGIGYGLARYAADVPQDDGSFSRECGTSLNIFENAGTGGWLIRHTSLNTLED